jgi:tRNA pseudouridine32 synthase / 23S rRNA pseudouridine746 synthase
VASLVCWIDPPHPPPTLLNNPFDTLPPDALTADLAERLQCYLDSDAFPAALRESLRRPDGGKMFGVLLIQAPDGRFGYLRGFSGQLEGRWDLPGFVPPVFNHAARLTVEQPGARTIRDLTAQIEAAHLVAAVEPAESALATLQATQNASLLQLKLELKQRKESRARRRDEMARAGEIDQTVLLELQQQSKQDSTRLRRAKEQWREREQQLRLRIHRPQRRLEALQRLRSVVSQVIARQIFDTYTFTNALGERRSLLELFAPELPPAGTGDCVGPKLLVYALQHKLTPLGLAEFWWGAPPKAGSRVPGMFFPACKNKCGPLLPFLVEGLGVAPLRRFRPKAAHSNLLPLCFEDSRFVVINKPEGLLSVPGTDAALTDSVWSRVKAAYSFASGPLLVHRLDSDTSGLLLVALDAEAYVALQRQFIERRIHKRYLAVVGGAVAADRGRISLPLRVDLEQRPRQLVDYACGKPAITDFEVLQREPSATRVAFCPVTGRTHQLRVHAAHPLGLGAAIVGDRLYGRAAARLMLHAEQLAFVHPFTGGDIVIDCPSPF